MLVKTSDELACLVFLQSCGFHGRSRVKKNIFRIQNSQFLTSSVNIRAARAHTHTVPAVRKEQKLTRREAHRQQQPED